MRMASVGVAKGTTLGAVLLCVASRSAPSAAQGALRVSPGLAWAACATIAASTDARRARRRGRLGARTAQYEDERWQAEHRLDTGPRLLHSRLQAIVPAGHGAARQGGSRGLSARLSGMFQYEPP